MIPEFAILGHPNEGKSSVLSTLAEDDSVRVSSTPGETTQCRTFPVSIDGKEIMRFIDTPGFQNPRRILHEMQNHNILDSIDQFINDHSQSDLKDDCELLRPVVAGAGIIYVVDASRPLRNVDRAEMEILRLTGKPRMAIMNCKEDESSYLDDWKNELRRNFNSIRKFNAHRATYAERISLLESLKNIDQDWQPILSKVVNSFKNDWEERNRQTTDILCTLISTCLSYSVSAAIRRNQDEEEIRKKLYKKYTSNMKNFERKAIEQIRALYKHNIFHFDLPPHSILHEDLFDAKTWKLLGLGKKRLALVGGIGGAALAASLDLAAGGASLGFFSTVGGVLGAVGTLMGGKQLAAKANFMGIGLGDRRMQIGPNQNIQFLFIIIDRVLLSYSHIINWAHGRRDYPHIQKDTKALQSSHPRGYTTDWSHTSLKICYGYFKAISSSDQAAKEKFQIKLKEIIASNLSQISNSE